VITQAVVLGYESLSARIALLSNEHIDDEKSPCKSIPTARISAMAVAECPNCNHDIQTPGAFRNRQWMDLKCPYCRAELQKKGRYWLEILPVLLALSGYFALPRKLMFQLDILMFVAFLATLMLDSARPKLIVKGIARNPVTKQRWLRDVKATAATMNLEKGRASQQGGGRPDATSLRLR
jgi:hypothetical protein